MTKDEYESNRYEIIKHLEEGGHENLDLYFDGKGILSTGVGFNLTEAHVLRQVLEDGLGVDASKVGDYAQKLGKIISSFQPKINETKAKQLERLQADLDKKLEELNGSPSHL